MYLAANGKIYITSGNGVQHLHEMNYPDSVGLGCDVQQHSIFLNIWNFRAVPNHPNYYLSCDTTLGCTCLANVGLQEIYTFNKLNIYPNPNSGNFNIGYDAMPQSSLLQVYDINGKIIYTQNLPPWSNEQNINLINVKEGFIC
ncbi:MAG: T9SS type A sorting domain-containing protein [Bacteroidetes bacterium]|nr:T9SS type A sorting domain-containing protein [Bacteroidota bacterium]